MRTSVDVHNALVELDVPHELVPIRGRIRRADRIAAVLGLDPAEVGRVHLFEGDGRVVAAVASSARRPDSRRVAEAAGLERAREVRGSRNSALTGFLGESVPPVGLPASIPVFLDRGLIGAEVVYFSGGEASSVLKIRGADLARATGGTVAELCREP